MSSIIRWRKGEILRAVGMGDPRGVVLLMASNDTGNPRRGKSRPTPTQRRRAQNARSPTLPRSGLVQWHITLLVFGLRVRVLDAPPSPGGSFRGGKKLYFLTYLVTPLSCASAV